MKDIVIIGAGGFGRETALMISQMNSDWRIIGFYDDQINKDEEVMGFKVLGPIKLLNKITDSLSVAVAIANPQTRARIVTKLTNSKIEFPVLVHPSANVGHSSNKVMRGSIITAGVILTSGISVGEFSIINLTTTVGHDCSIGSFASIMPQCSLAGNVTLGDRTFIGTGARVLQGLSIGDDAIVGAGAIVTKNIDKNITVVGVPAKKI